MLNFVHEVEGRLDTADVAMLFAWLGALRVLASAVTRRIKTRMCPRTVREVAHDRVLTVKQAVKQYPISRAWLYERGEALGLLQRPPGLRKVVVIEAALRAYLDTGVASAGPVPKRRNLVGQPVRRRQTLPDQHGDNRGHSG